MDINPDAPPRAPVADVGLPASEISTCRSTPFLTVGMAAAYAYVATALLLIFSRRRSNQRDASGR
jgi:hypothetical protein